MLRKICIAFISVEVVLFVLTSFARTITHGGLDFSLASAQSSNDGSESSDADDDASNPTSETRPETVTSGGSGGMNDDDLGTGYLWITFAKPRLWGPGKVSGTWESSFSNGTHHFTGSADGSQLILKLEDGGPHDKKCYLNAVGLYVPGSGGCAISVCCWVQVEGTYEVLNCGETLKGDSGTFNLGLYECENHFGF